MERLIAETLENVRKFVAQRDKFLLVVGADDGDMSALLAILRSLDEYDATDVHLLFPDIPENEAQYVAALMTRVVGQITLVNQVIDLESLPEPRWPELPHACLDPRIPPRDRFVLLFDYLRERLPEGDHRILFALVPMEIRNPQAYASVVGSLWPSDQALPSMRKVRVLAREPRSDPYLSRSARTLPTNRVASMIAALDTAALTNALVAETANPEAPVEERMKGLLQLAMIDFAHRRYPAAMEKYRILYSHYYRGGNKLFAAQCLQGIGDVFRYSGDLPRALTQYRRTLALTLEVEPPVFPALYNVLRSLGDVHLELRQPKDALDHYEYAQNMAYQMMSHFARADALELVGVAKCALRDVAGAIAVWDAALELCRKTEYFERWESILERRIQVYEQNGLHDRKRVDADELLGMRHLRNRRKTA
ncbi:MAG: tetratricopeptide repeat protein [Polyangiales bacterium]